MGLRFQRRVGIAPGVRLNVSKSGIGGSVGRTGLRLGVNAKRKRYFLVGLPGTGLSYRAFFGRPVTTLTVRLVGYAVVAALCLLALVALTIRSG